MNEITQQAFYAPLSVLWQALRRQPPLRRADCIVGFGNYNCDIAKRAAELYHGGYAEKILFTGGLGRNTLGYQNITEAERFAATAVAEGVPETAILVENRSSNTAENIRFTTAMLRENGIEPRVLIGVHQPFMERRIAAAYDVFQPETELLTTSYEADIPTFLAHAEEYGVTRKMVIEEVVGDFQRMELYAQKGWQSPQPMPAEAWEAYRELVAQGYGGQLA